MSSTRAVAATATTPWLDAVEMAAWRNYVDCIAPLQQAFEYDLVQFGLTMGDYEVLVRLSEADDHRMRMCDLAVQLRLSPSGLTRRLDGLVTSGFVGRQPSAEDRRVALAVLTDQGHELLVSAAPHHVASVRTHYLDLLTATELRAIGTAFAKVRDALAARQNACP